MQLVSPQRSSTAVKRTRRDHSVGFKEQPPATRDRERRRRPIYLL
jgi:hypothetical protein